MRPTGAHFHSMYSDWACPGLRVSALDGKCAPFLCTGQATDEPCTRKTDEMIVFKCHRRQCTSIMLLLFCLGGFVCQGGYGEVFSNGDFVFDTSGALLDYSGSASEVIIPSTATYYEDYEGNDGEMHTRIHTIDVKTIGQAFRDKPFITSVIFPSHLESIGGGAFTGHTGLTSVSFPNGLKVIGRNAFAGCTALTSVRTPESLTSLGDGAFTGCTNLIEAEINGTNLDLRESQLFAECSNLRRIVFGNGVTRLHPRWYYQSNDMFFGCTNLQTVTVGTGVTVVPAYFFYGCGNASDGLSVCLKGIIHEVGQGAFANKNITKLSITLSKCTVGKYSFRSCPAVTTESIDFSQITSIDAEAFRLCTNIVGELNLSSCQSIGLRAFDGCTGLIDVEFSEELTSIDSSAFGGCSSLVSIRTPISLRSLGGYVFEDCTNLVETEILGTQLDLSCSEGLFAGCSRLRRVKFGDGVTQLCPRPVYQSYTSSTFFSCTNLQSVTVGSGVSSVPDFFLNGCGNATDKLSVSFAGAIGNIGRCAFTNNNITNLSITLSNSTIGRLAFYSCPAVTTESIDFAQISSIDEEAFHNCPNISGVVNLSRALSIGRLAFAGCTGITSVNFASTVASIDSYAFSGCTNAFTFAFNGAPPNANSTSFDNVKAGAIGTYTAAHKSEWESVIVDGKWNGLIMAANKPILSNCGCNVSAGEFTFSWSNEAAPMPSGITFEIRRGFSENYSSSEILTNGYSGLTFVDKDFYTTGGVSRIWYWVKPEHPLFEASEPIVTRTRHAILVGLSAWDDSVHKGLKDTGGASNVVRFTEIATSVGGFQITNIHQCVDRLATTNNVRQKFINVADTTSPGDICVFFFNTHGGIKANGTSSLALYDGDYTEMQLAQDIGLLDAEGKGLAVIGIVSACHSGALFDNPDQTVSRTSWYLRNGLAQCSANVSWVTSSGAMTSSYGVFTDFLLDYGWRQGWAKRAVPMTFLDLATYTKRQYDSLFSGIVYENENDEKKVQIENPSILSKIFATDSGSSQGLDSIKPDAPVIKHISKGEYRGKIEVTAQVVAGADRYYAFCRIGSDGSWFAMARNKSEPKFIIHSSMIDDEHRNLFNATSESLRAYFVLKAVNGAGVSELSAEDYGWVDSSWDVVFHAGKGSIVGSWQGTSPTLDSKTLIKTMQRGEQMVFGNLPNAIRDGYTLVGWFTIDKKQASPKTIVWDNVVYYACWTDMTQEWLKSHVAFASEFSGNIVAAATMPAANTRFTLAECYAFGIDPEDPNDDLRITDFKIENGKPVITLNHTENGSGNSFLPRIKTLGKASISDASEEWREIPENGDPTMRFFKVMVEMP